MAKDKLTEYDATAANNTVVGDVNLAENSCLPSDLNNAVREVMSHQKEAFGSGTPLYVDQTNNRLGIGDSAPDTPVHITKTVNTAYSATNTTSNANNLLKLENPSSTAGVFAGVMFRTGSGADGGLNWVQGTGNDGSFTFTNQNSTDVEMMRIQSNGLVGIGTASPAVASGTGLQIHNAASGAQARLSITNNSTGSASSDGLQLVVENGGGALVEQRENQHLGFATNASERMRVTSDGSFLVGKSSSSTTTAGFETQSSGLTAIVRDSNPPLYVGRNTDDGQAVVFRQGSTTIGSISVGNGDLLIGTGAVNLRFFDATPAVIPRTASDGTSDGVIALGNTSNRFSTGFFSAGVQARYHYNGEDTDTYIDFATGNLVKFFIGGSEAMRINASSHVNIGQSATNIPGQGNSQAGTSLRSVGDAYFSRDGDIALNVNRNGSDGKVVSFRRGGTEGGSISVTTTSATLASSSDARLKSNIEDAASASDKIDAIQVRQFDWNETGDHQDYGLIAQELQAIEPLAVVGSPDSEEMMGVDNSKLIPMLIKEIQSLRSRVATLEAN